MKQAKTLVIVGFSLFMVWQVNSAWSSEPDQDNIDLLQAVILQHDKIDFNAPENRKDSSPLLCYYTVAAEYFVSPSTRYLVLPSNQSSDEAVIYISDTQSGQKTKITGNFRSIGWEGQRDVLWLRNGSNLFTFDGKILAPQPAASQTYQKLKSKWFTRREGLSQGVVIFRSRGGRRITFFDLRSNKIVDVKIPSAPFRTQIGLSETTGKTSYFVSWNSTSPERLKKNTALADIKMFRHLRVVDETGALQTEVKVAGKEVRFLPRLSKNGVFVLARFGDKRCLWVIDQHGQRTATAFSNCDTDIENVYFDSDGKILFVKQMNRLRNAYSEENFFKEVTGFGLNASDLSTAFVSPMGGATFLNLAAGQLPEIVLRRPDHSLFKTNLSCHAKVLETSLPILATSDNGLEVYGFLHLPNQQKPKGIIVEYHGGPQSAFSDIAHPYSSLFTKEGFAVLSVNFRGSTGYGKKYLEAGYNWVPQKMVNDGLALLSEAQKQYEEFDQVPVYVVGYSWGGHLALLALSRKTSPFTGGLLIAPACNSTGIPNITKKVLRFSKTIRNLGRDLINIRYYQTNDINALDNCESKIKGNRRTFIVHGVDDPLVDVKDVRRMVAVQDPSIVQAHFIEGAGHRVRLKNTEQRAIEFWQSGE